MKDRATKQDGSGESRRLALFYMKALIDIARESFLILDSDLKVISANPISTRPSGFRRKKQNINSSMSWETENGTFPD